MRNGSKRIQWNIIIVIGIPCLLFFQEGKFRRYDVPDVGEVFKQPGRTNSWTNGATGHGEEKDGTAAEQNASKVQYVVAACIMVRVGAALAPLSPSLQKTSEYYLLYFFVFLYMFRAILCSSTGGSIVYTQHLVLYMSLFLGDRSVH